MDSDRDRPSTQKLEHDMKDEAGRMERRLDELGDHVDDAAAKARQTREQAGIADDEDLDTVAGDSGERTTSSDDSTSAAGDPEDADEPAS